MAEVLLIGTPEDIGMNALTAMNELAAFEGEIHIISPEDAMEAGLIDEYPDGTNFIIQAPEPPKIKVEDIITEVKPLPPEKKPSHRRPYKYHP